MGSTFSTVQLHNAKRLPPEPFAGELNRFFAAKGLVPATEEDAEVSYWLALNPAHSWATLGGGGYDLGTVHAELPEIAAVLNTHCVLTSVWDSDFAELELFGPSPGPNDTIVIGQPYEEDRNTKGNPDLWKPLLAEGRTWAQVEDVCGKSYVCAEDALPELAPLLGMDPQSVTYAYNCSEEVSSNAPHVMDLHFKKAVQPSGNIIAFAQPGKAAPPVKAMSLNAAFKKVFGDALAPLGFVKLKGRHPYLVRMVGDEILHVITCKEEWILEQHKKTFLY
jgi:hypothetical protein